MSDVIYRFGSADHFLWLDLEMTNLSPINGKIMEVAAIVTKGTLEPISSSAFHRVIRLTPKDLKSLSEWSQTHHRIPRGVNNPSLVDLCQHSPYLLNHVDKELAALMDTYREGARMIVAGSSIGTDLRFVHEFMPEVSKRVHFRVLDVSTVLELCRRIYPGIQSILPRPTVTHCAMDDVWSSLQLLVWFQQHTFLPFLPYATRDGGMRCIAKQLPKMLPMPQTLRHRKLEDSFAEFSPSHPQGSNTSK